jgi:hypothetical protein
LAFISVVCGDELVAEITSYTTAAEMPITAASASPRGISGASLAVYAPLLGGALAQEVERVCG